MPLDVVPYQNEMGKYGFIPSNHEKPNWFPVKIGEVYDDRSRVVPNYRRVYRDDSGDTLAVHSDKYLLIPYEDAFNAFDSALGVSGLNLDNLHVCTDLTHNGARCFRQYVLPHYTIEVGKNGHTALRIIMFNSYDGSLSFSGMAGGYTFVCANTSVFGNHLVRLSVKHVGKSGKRIEVLISNLVQTTADAVKRIELMRAWKDVYPSIESLKTALKVFPQVSETLIDRFVSNVAVAEDKSLWGMYNVLTAWSSHAESKSNHAATRSAREQRVGAFIDQPAWKQLEAA